MCIYIYFCFICICILYSVYECRCRLSCHSEEWWGCVNDWDLGTGEERGGDWCVRVFKFPLGSHFVRKLPLWQAKHRKIKHLRRLDNQSILAQNDCNHVWLMSILTWWHVDMICMLAWWHYNEINKLMEVQLEEIRVVSIATILFGWPEEIKYKTSPKRRQDWNIWQCGKIWTKTQGILIQRGIFFIKRFKSDRFDPEPQWEHQVRLVLPQFSVQFSKIFTQFFQLNINHRNLRSYL